LEEYIKRIEKKERKKERKEEKKKKNEERMKSGPDKSGLYNTAFDPCNLHKKEKRKKKRREKKEERSLTGYMSNFCFHSDLLAGHLVTSISAIKSTFVPTFSLSHLDVSIAGPVPRQLEKYLTLIALLAVSFISTELEMASYCSRISSTTLLESSDNFPAKEPSTCFVNRL